MDKVNLNFNGSSNVVKSIMWILSVISWLMYLITGFISFRWLEKWGWVWTIIRHNMYTAHEIGIHHHKTHDAANYYPFQLQAGVLYITFSVMLVLGLVAFIIYMVKSTCKKSDMFEKMMGDWARFHCIPLFMASGLFIIFEAYTPHKSWKGDWVHRDASIAGIILVIIGLASLIFVYIKTDTNPEWLDASVKKGAYSSLITVMWYYLLYVIMFFVLDDSKPGDEADNTKNCGIAMPIVFGVGILVFAFFLKDVLSCGLAAVMYAGMAGYYFRVDKNLRKNKWHNKNADGAIDLVFMVLCIAMLVFLIITKKKECLK